jgi:hypothetical protein
MPSELQLASSFSLIGWNATRSRDVNVVAPGVRSSVEFFTLTFSGFHIRSVLSAEPVAMNVPDAFHDIVRMKCEDDTEALGRGLSMYVDVLSFEKWPTNMGLLYDRARIGGAILGRCVWRSLEGLSVD